MRGRWCRAVVFVLTFSAASPATLVVAQTAADLRQEIDVLRQEMTKAAQAYERRLEELSERLRQIQGAVQPTPAPGAPMPSPVPPASSPPSLPDLARPRQPFALAPAGSGLLFDIGVSGDFVAGITSSTRERRADGTFAGRENRFFPREVSVGFFGRVDPYASATVRIGAGEEEDARGGELAVVLDEAYLSLLTLPFGTTARLGLMRPRFGTLNTVHDDDLPQVDRPSVLARFFGDSGLEGERGVEAFWVLPLSMYHELAVGLFDGDNEVAFGRGSLRDPLVTGRWRTFFELEDAGGLQIDVSAASGVTADERRNTVLGFGAKYKWSAPGTGMPMLTVAGEALVGIRNVHDDAGADGERRVRWGAYLYAQYDAGRRWAAGLRGDWTELPAARGREWAISPYVQFKPSEFLRFRLQYKHSEGTGVVERIADEIFLQGSFILGAHPTERF